MTLVSAMLRHFDHTNQPYEVEPDFMPTSNEFSSCNLSEFIFLFRTIYEFHLDLFDNFKMVIRRQKSSAN